MLNLECSQGCYRRTNGRMDGSVTISLRNFVGEGIIKQQGTIEEISIFSNSRHLELRVGEHNFKRITEVPSQLYLL
jgi:hypothetical protein